MPIPFIGREYEKAALARLLKKRIATLVVIKGRRRIGKSRLIEEFAKDFTFYKFSGIAPTPETTEQSEINEFIRQYKEQLGGSITQITDWGDAFYILAQQVKTGRVVILFDEISWMGSKDPHFLGKIKNAWDMYFKSNHELIFILCGSVTTWIDKNILASTGFVGRISMRLTLEELSIEECNQFWQDSNSYISPFEKLKILSVTGGIPRYLEEIDPNAPADENIKHLCFIKDGLLVNEFQDIFSDIFSHRSAQYKRIVEQLEDGPKSATEIAELLDITYTGTFNEYLEDLVKSGFLSRDYTWHFKTGKVAKLSHFRLSDNYVRFYLKYIDPIKAKIEKGDYNFKSLSSLPGWNSIMGYQFENLVLHNKNFIRQHLGLTSDDIVSDNPYFQRATKHQQGCQIDYLIQTKYGGLYACEIKFSLQPVGMSVIKEMEAKIDRLSRPHGFSVWPILIHGNEVQQEVIDSGFFTKIIDFSELLKNKKKR